MAGVLHIRDVDDDVRDCLKARARADGMSLSAYVSRELTRLTSRPTNAEVFRRTQQRQRTRESRALEPISPLELPTPPTYSHAIMATGSRMLFVAGQEPEDAEGNLVGASDLAVQAHQVFANLGRALAAGGAGPEHVARITIYVVGHRPAYLPIIEEARVALFGDHQPVDTLVGVETLARPEYLIEVDATAVLD